MPVRNYSSSAAPATLTAQATDLATIIQVSAVLGWPVSTPYTLILAPDTGNEEVVEVTAVSDLSLTVVRAVDGTTARTHNTGTTVRHGVSARDFREPNQHANTNSNVHGVGAGNSVVGTETSQVLKNKTINSAHNSLTVAKADVSGLVTDLTNKADKVIEIATTGGLTGGGNLTANRSISIEDEGVTTGKIGPSAVTTAKIGDNQVTTAKIPNEAVTLAKLAPDVVAVPIGSLLPFAGPSAPTRFLACNGAAVSRVTYAALFSIIGTNYGVGDGTTTFNLPNLNGRTPVGVANDWDELDALGKSHGSRTHTLTTSELPPHTHPMPHTHSGNTNTSGVVAAFGNSDATVSAGSTQYQSVRAGTDNFDKTIRSGSHYHPFVTGQPDAPNTVSSGSGAAHNNTQPSLAVNYIIRAA